MSTKTVTITGDFEKKRCGSVIKIIKNGITVYIKSGKSGEKNKNNTLTFRIKPRR